MKHSELRDRVQELEENQVIYLTVAKKEAQDTFTLVLASSQHTSSNPSLDLELKLIPDQETEMTTETEQGKEFLSYSAVLKQEEEPMASLPLISSTLTTHRTSQISSTN